MANQATNAQQRCARPDIAAVPLSSTSIMLECRNQDLIMHVDPNYAFAHNHRLNGITHHPTV
jgi:hypothetical protein